MILKQYSKKVIIIFCGILLLCCNRGETHFYRPKERIIARAFEGKYYYDDVVFIENPPEDTKELIHLIEQYNAATVSKDSVQKRYNNFERIFYRVSRKTPVNFKDDESFAPDYLYDHHYDLIAKYRMKTDWFENKSVWSLSSRGGYLHFEDIYY